MQCADCTPKAVSHRLNNIRGGGKSGATRSAPNTPKSKRVATPKTAGGRAKVTPRKKVDNDYDSGPEGPIDDAEEMQSPSAARGKRAANNNKISYAESDSETEGRDDGMQKRVKTEPDEQDEFEAYNTRELSADEV